MDKSNSPASEDSRRELSALDADFIRVLEDLIEALLANGTLRLTDLPPQALEKLNQRKRVRQRVRGSLDLIDDDEELL
ncbi:hypothetical protein [Comamonas endophytica]|uniref:Tryptophan synthase subunit beta like protein n=1 Tax=Comamonas endophytica TaxID=2949090 RepID=A0ABY6GAD0_9BURK|nr:MULTISPECIES: hypothetical protein [unclassified Acidovorax]MCD2514011.1 hypothetical protein [Acidovorax sp. D4N7]UYG51999.1 hypothetical protein M9799_01770 [Acidovorax sp. 5MLIR]